jgi:gliding motility-associated-like protein
VNPVAGPDSTTEYLLQVSDGRGCTAADSITINVFELIDVYLPNAFTPNNDNNNDVLFVLGNPAKATIEQFMIFDRWGELLFKSENFLPNDPQFGWDGKYKGAFALVDSYVFYIGAVMTNGDRKEYKGTITLLR